MDEVNKCPGCSCHCERDNLQCGKGEAYFRGENISAYTQSHKEDRRRDGRHHGHRKPEFPAGSLADLMTKCTHRLFHGSDESVFSVLSDQEQHALQNILVKLLDN